MILLKNIKPYLIINYNTDKIQDGRFELSVIFKKVIKLNNYFFVFDNKTIFKNRNQFSTNQSSTNQSSTNPPSTNQSSTNPPSTKE